MTVLLSSRTWFSRPERSQPERTRREDRHSKFYAISDNLREGEDRVIVFPRYHQWSAVLTTLADARAKGAGHNYLIEHSAGSGKSEPGRV